jgi:hypothetical protein
MLRGNVTAQIFWLKTRARRRETPLELKHSGSIARKDPSELSDEELFAPICQTASQTGANEICACVAQATAMPNASGSITRPDSLTKKAHSLPKCFAEGLRRA